MIDNYAQAIALIEKMNEHLPITMYPGQQFLKMLKERGESCNEKTELIVASVDYSGDEGGILCSLKSDSDSQFAYIISLTHLIVPNDHSLAFEIKSYQKKRIVRLAMADGKMGKAKRLAMKNRKKKGF